MPITSRRVCEKEFSLNERDFEDKQRERHRPLSKGDFGEKPRIPPIAPEREEFRRKAADTAHRT